MLQLTGAAKQINKHLKNKVLIMAAVSHRKGFPSDASGKEVAWRCKRHRFNPWIRKIPWKKEMRTQSSILACKTSWTEEIHRLQSMVPTNQRPLSDWVLASLASRISRVHPAEDSLPSPLTVRLPSLRSSLAASWNFSSLTGGSSNWQHGSRLPQSEPVRQQERVSKK